ncbi:MAG: hypothetical protein KIS81_09905 [Maricaulaceae bacterium]|nr:hypothetical protein [Maricaulaceae bacterium]
MPDWFSIAGFLAERLRRALWLLLALVAAHLALAQETSAPQSARAVIPLEDSGAYTRSTDAFLHRGLD